MLIINNVVQNQKKLPECILKKIWSKKGGNDHTPPSFYI